MKKNIMLMLSAICLICWQPSQAQTTTPTNNPPSTDGNNLIKVNLSGIAVNAYMLQYERVLNNEHQSFTLTVGVSPNVPLPFRNTLMNDFGNNADAKRAIQTTTFTKTTVTLAYRFYVSKKKHGPFGFYVAPFARYMNMSISQNYTFTPSDGQLHTAHLNAHFDGFGAGVLIGAQFPIGKHIALDWWILGPFYGIPITADFYGTDPKMGDLSPQDRANLKGNIEGTKLPLYTTTATIGETSIDAKLNGPYYGVRAFGIALGYRF